MDPFEGFSDETRKRFNQTVERAEQEYNQKIAAARRADNIAIDLPSFLESEKTSAKKAALEYLGTLLFFLLDVCSAMPLPDDELRHRMNTALAVLRKLTLDHKWPTPMPLRPYWREREEQEFDRALIQWLEHRDEWRKYEARVVPQIAIAPEVHTRAQEASGPLCYFPCWQLENLSARAGGRVKAGLLEIHGAFLDRKLKDLECWRRAYDLIADEFDRARLLSEDLIYNKMPEIIADVIASGGWSEEPLGQAQATAVFSDHFGSQFYPLWRRDAILEALQGRLTHWSGRLVLNPAATGAVVSDKGRKPRTKQHVRVAQMVADLGSDWKTDANLERVAEWMDAEPIEVDSRWRKDYVYNWASKLALDKVKFVKAIEYRLARTKK